MLCGDHGQNAGKEGFAAAGIAIGLVTIPAHRIEKLDARGHFEIRERDGGQDIRQFNALDGCPLVIEGQGAYPVGQGGKRYLVDIGARLPAIALLRGVHAGWRDHQAPFSLEVNPWSQLAGREWLSVGKIVMLPPAALEHQRRLR